MTTQRTITVTQCDNELVLTAYQWGASFIICRILSGNTNPVNITINLTNGQYQGPLVLDGITTELKGTYNVALAAGTYDVVGVGINWGGPTGFKYSIGDKTIQSPATNEIGGVVFTAGPTNIQI
ncbi:MAG: hypothetical protein MUC81_04120 [Bacteroidia bacterium]|jgi:hypothetical protein|nr:hypothetical protein [Bacteroidia bacterium]